MVNQFYKAEILTEYVIRGNTAVLKCSIPSFVADFVVVDSWIDDDGKIIKPTVGDFGNFIFRIRSRSAILSDRGRERVRNQREFGRYEVQDT